MIISKTVQHLPLAVSVPTIGILRAKQHLVRHRHLFDDFVLSLNAAEEYLSTKTGTRATRLSLCIETSRVRLSSTADASRLSSDDGYFFSVDLASHLTHADIRVGVEQGALAYFASIHSQVLAMNNLDCGDMYPWIRMRAVMNAIELDSHALCSIILNAAKRHSSEV